MCDHSDEASPNLVSNLTSKNNLLKGVTVSRWTLPDDANIYGNVHGGTILKLIEEAGAILATRYCNTAGPVKPEPCIAAMVRIEHMDFLMPMKIGDVAHLTAEIVFTSAHSLLVEVMVQAEDIIAGTRRKTNRARLWYVPLEKSGTVQSVPQMQYCTPEEEERGKRSYEEQKTDREKNPMPEKSVIPYTGCTDCEAETVQFSQTCLSFLVGPNDVTFNRHCRGGVLLKLMDECAGIVAVKHCRTNVVTACLNATNFYKMIQIGSVVTVCGQITFTSNRSLEVEVVVEFVTPFEKNSQSQRAVDAFFTYVSIDEKGKALPVLPLKVQTEEEKARYIAGEQRYQNRKQKMQMVK